MKIIHVIPITRGISKERLSYFSIHPIEKGTVVKAAIRGKQTPLLVVGEEDAGDIKSKIKLLSFEIKKIAEQKGALLLTKNFLESAEKIAEFFGTNTGNVLNALIPATLFKHLPELNNEKTISIKKNNGQRNLHYILQADESERFSHYKSVVREEFAKHQSIFCMVPTIEDGKKLLETLSPGIETYAYFFHASLRPKELISLWNKAKMESHPILIIGTGNFLSIPREDIGTIVVEGEHGSGYKTITRPYLDHRISAEIHAKHIGARLILGDAVLRAETLYRAEKGEFEEFTTPRWRLFRNSLEKVIDMRKKEDAKEKTFEIFSPELLSLISHTEQKKEHLFIFAARKGYATSTLCQDCGTVVTCHKCKAPLVLHHGKRNGENFFLCHHCGEKRSAQELCLSCGSWRLIPLGIGIERIEEELKKKFPHIQVFIIDRESAKTAKEIEQRVTLFYSTPGSLLLGTEIVLPYLNKKIEHSAIVSIDSLFSIPDFRINEKILKTLASIKLLTLQHFLVQTRNPEQKVLFYATDGNLLEFYRNEIEERQLYGYPPFSWFIKITLRGDRARILSEMEKIHPLFTEYENDVFPAFSSDAKGRSVLHMLIKLPREKWVDQGLLAKLRSLPPFFEIRIDPENLL